MLFDFYILLNMFYDNRRRNNELKFVKSLKFFCKEKLLKTYNIENNFVRIPKFTYAVNAFQKIQATLSKQVFMKIFGNEDRIFEKYLWFVHQFVWNRDVNLYIKDHNATFSSNWASVRGISEISFLGCNYLDGRICILLGNNYLNDHNYSTVELSPKMFTYQSKLTSEAIVSCHKQINLTVISQEWLYELDDREIFPVLFDLQRGIAFDFCKTIKFLDFPAFSCKAKTYTSLMRSINGCFTFNLDYNYWDCLDNTPCIVRIINKSSKRLKRSNKEKFKKSSCILG